MAGINSKKDSGKEFSEYLKQHTCKFCGKVFSNICNHIGNCPVQLALVRKPKNINKTILESGGFYTTTAYVRHKNIQNLYQLIEEYFNCYPVEKYQTKIFKPSYEKSNVWLSVIIRNTWGKK